MKKPIIRVFKEDNVEIDIAIIIKKLNNITDTFKFIIGKHQFSIPDDRVYVDEKDNVSLKFSDEISSECSKDYETIFITNKAYTDEFFFHEVQKKKTLLSFYQWTELTKYSKNTGLFYFIIDILALEIDQSERHENDSVTECIYNFSWDKTEITDGIKSAIICESCQERIMDENNENKKILLDDIILMLEELKKSNAYNDIVKYWNFSSKEQVKIFFSYSHKDREYLEEFKDYIKIFERNGLVERWDDNELVVGEKWNSKIEDKIYSADIIIFLLSASSLASDYIYNNELKLTLELNENDEAYVIPIVIKDCLWDMTEFKEFQILPIDGKAVNSWRLREEAWTATARGLKKAIDNIILSNQKNSERIQDNNRNSKLGKILESVKRDDSDKEIVLKFLKTYKRWWFNVPRIINWGSERDGFQRLKNIRSEELKTILEELKCDEKVVSKRSTKNKNSSLYKAT